MRATMGFLSVAAFLTLVHPVNALADGPDVILGELDGVLLFPQGDTIYLAAGTTSCNAGNGPLAWRASPDNQHPVIALNLYKQANGRLYQIGQSWLKHGFMALEHDICGFGCKPTFQGNQLGPGCSDPYGAGLNRGPNLGARSEVNATTGHFDGSGANNHAGHSHASDLEHSLQIDAAELKELDALYFIEGHYITADDIAAGNGMNNVSYRRLRLRNDDGQLWLMNAGLTERQKPAITAWEGATTHDVDAVEASAGSSGTLSRVVVASKVTQLQGMRHRYEYAIYNMNSDRSIGSFRVPVGSAAIIDIGFHAVRSHGEAWSNDPWQARVQDGWIEWRTSNFSENPDANAIRWGTTYNFWFDAEVAPTVGEASLSRFKPGEGPNELTVRLEAPSATGN
ncbi:hypothetical protein KXS15_24810 [Sinorhizobium meliloti]|uniref:hypothetical protein n=1 Tax=Rhizobium meliloti TaxID=382 RepID=UPI003F189DBD